MTSPAARYFAIIILITSTLIGAVAAIQLDYQELSDYSDYSNCKHYGGTGGYCLYQNNISAGNSYIYVQSGVVGDDEYLMYATPSQTNYAAATCLQYQSAFGGARIRLFDASFNSLGSYSLGSNGRFEVVTDGSTAVIYADGIQVNSFAISQNPTYVGFGAYSSTGGAVGTAAWDDVVYGTTEDTTIIGMPADGAFYIKKDMVNPASSGLFNASTNTVVYSSYLPFSFSRSNLSGLSRINDTIYLINAQTGTVYANLGTGVVTNIYTTSGSPYPSTQSFNIGNALIAAGAPYGWYQIKINNTLSTRIAFIANGANINFDKSGYSIGDLATMTYLVDSAYWLPGEYTYRVVIVDAFGTVHNTQNIATSSGTVTYTWDSATDTQGVYFAEIIADRISDGEDVLLQYDYATLTAAFGFNGYVNAYNATPISGALVTYAQGSTIVNSTSGYDGNYSASGFLTGIPIWSNVSATGYQTQNFTFTVQNGHTITRNITLNATAPTYTGLGIGGVCRDGNFTSPNSITNGYGRPIPGATCFLKNTSNAELYSTTGNNAGWYLFDESVSVYLTANRPYDQWCQKTGYGNSPNETVQVTV